MTDRLFVLVHDYAGEADRGPQPLGTSSPLTCRSECGLMWRGMPRSVVFVMAGSGDLETKPHPADRHTGGPTEVTLGPWAAEPFGSGCAGVDSLDAAE